MFIKRKQTRGHERIAFWLYDRTNGLIPMAESPPSVEAVAAFIENIHIFRGISDTALFDISESLQDKRVNAGDVILNADEKAGSFYIIYSGKIKVLREKGQPEQLLVRGDYFGVDALLADEERGSKLVAKSKALLLELPAEAITTISDSLDYVRSRLKLFLECRAKAKMIHFDWIEPDEVIYYVQNKHHFLFLQRLPIPALLILQGPFVLFFGMWVGAIIPLIFGSVGFVVGLIWLLWNWVDWRNDYYIITSHRVVWVEKIVGIFDSRQEAHLREVNSVSVKTDVIMQSMFDYGHVSVKTIFGGIDLLYVPAPQLAHILLEELWRRAQDEEKQEATDRLHQAIINEIKAAQAVNTKKRPFAAPQSSAPAFTAPPPPKKTLRDFLPRIRFNAFNRKPKPKKKAQIFNLRYEEKGEVVYRKHIMVLIQQAGVPALVALFLFGMFFYQLFLFFFVKDAAVFSISFIILLAVGGIGAIGWMIYQYVDWSNDIFKISSDKVFDIDRKPFGDVQSRSAPIENMESLEYQKTGLLSVFFNYGTVYMHIGDAEFEFENVLDPAAVLQDINHRIKAIQEYKKEAQAKRERDDMVKWLVAYHQSADKFNAMLDELEKAKRDKAAKEGRDEEAE